MTLCFSTPNCILPLYISLAVIILFFLLPFSSLFQGHCRVKSNLILKYVSIVTSVTSVILSCDGCTDAHWFFMHTHQGAVLSVCIRHVNHGVHPSLFLVTWLIKSVKTSNWFIWLDSITLCLVCYDMPWFPDIFVNFKLWHFLWNQLLLFLKKDIQNPPPKTKKGYLWSLQLFNPYLEILDLTQMLPLHFDHTSITSCVRVSWTSKCFLC